MKALEAKALTKETTLEGLLEQIKKSAEQGERGLFIPPLRYIKDETKYELIRLGYNIRSVVDFAGVSSIIIEWV